MRKTECSLYLVRSLDYCKSQHLYLFCSILVFFHLFSFCGKCEDGLGDHCPLIDYPGSDGRGAGPLDARQIHERYFTAGMIRGCLYMLQQTRYAAPSCSRNHPKFKYLSGIKKRSSKMLLIPLTNKIAAENI